ncbi:ISAs1 family transposase [Methylotuvimicrobium alcaliphilum]|uniref:H repeat-associated protein yhhI n=1 Tax=Methylotuvimicrobium alcaliphilum (strain DSM 19304 / NCIMB 14124 / VKM B-2133 / 20Z) TaxID=1091494 RepID=G4T4D4_META2|nr:ISAs1 family transposase [Methylotuvimicrobium alcaliphilum]CCE24945.1 H repeat-associated protein yhhI [Methylotuvimicrobium alcaliphilum 20Z]
MLPTDCSLIKHFSNVTDPRIERKKLHQLMDIIVLTVCASLSGAEGWEAIEEFGHNKLDWLRQFVPLKNGIPSHDCLAYVISRLSPKEFQRCFIDWVNAIREVIPDEVIAIDGKTARRSHDRKRGQNPLHMVSAWGCANGLVLGQEATEEKSNEITAIPKLLALLELKGCIVTIDAMGCQRTIAEQIVDQGGDYCLGLKGNQGELHEAVEDFFNTAKQANFNHVEYAYHEEIDNDHGRLETRRYWITEALCTLPKTELWKELRSIGFVERECHIGDKVTIEQRCFINSIKADAQLFARAVRHHWGIENQLHWRLDVVFREDDNRIRKGNAAAIMTTIRHICVNLFQQEESKLSMKKKRLKAAWNDRYRAKLLLGK